MRIRQVGTIKAFSSISSLLIFYSYFGKYLFWQIADEPRVLRIELALRPRAFAVGLFHEQNVAIGACLLLRRDHVQTGSNLQPFTYKDMSDVIETVTDVSSFALVIKYLFSHASHGTKGM